MRVSFSSTIALINLITKMVSYLLGATVFNKSLPHLLDAATYLETGYKNDIAITRPRRNLTRRKNTCFSDDKWKLQKDISC